jgi:hypothetical protein
MLLRQSKITEKDIPFVIKLLKEGKSFVDIGNIFGINYRTVSYYIRKLHLLKYTKHYDLDQRRLGNEFEVIDTPEKAYTLGFILGDGYLTLGGQDGVEITQCIRDREVIDFIAGVLKANVYEHKRLDKKSRTFPHVSLVKKIPHISKHLGGRLKPERHFPIIKRELERFLVLGLLDADGCISYGFRKDRNRFWCTVRFVHHLKCLTGLQRFLINRLGISTTVRPKSKENAYVLEFSSRKDVLNFLNYVYPDDKFVVLKRKYNSARAVRLEWEENGEGAA